MYVKSSKRVFYRWPTDAASVKRSVSGNRGKREGAALRVLESCKRSLALSAFKMSYSRVSFKFKIENEILTYANYVSELAVEHLLLGNPSVS